MKINISLIIILCLFATVFCERNVLERTVARVGKHTISEIDIMRFYSLFMDLGQPPVYDQSVRELVLRELVQYYALTEYLDRQHLFFDEKNIQRGAREFFQQFKDSFSSHDEYSDLLQVLQLHENDVREMFTEYFITRHKLDILVERQMRDEEKVQLELIEEKRFLFDLLILSAREDPKKLIKITLQSPDLDQVRKTLEDHDINVVQQRLRVSEQEQIHPELYEVLNSLSPGGISLPFTIQDRLQIVQLLDISWYTYERRETLAPGEQEALKQNMLQKALDSVSIEYYD